MIMHRKIITLNTIHIVYNRTEQATVDAVLLCFWNIIFIQDEVLYDVQFIIMI